MQWTFLLFIRSGQNHLAQWKREEDKEDRRRGGKTESGNGQAWSSSKSQRAVENGKQWRKLVVKSSVVPQRPSWLGDRWRRRRLYNPLCTWTACCIPEPSGTSLYHSTAPQPWPHNWSHPEVTYQKHPCFQTATCGNKAKAVHHMCALSVLQVQTSTAGVPSREVVCIQTQWCWRNNDNK